MAYSLTFQNPNDNLTDEEVAKYMEKITKVLTEKVEAEVRWLKIHLRRWIFKWLDYITKGVNLFLEFFDGVLGHYTFESDKSMFWLMVYPALLIPWGK